MISRKGMVKYFGVTIGTVNRWIKEGRIPSTLENLETGLWDEEIIEKVEYKPKVTLDTELIRSLAKKHTTPEIARKLGATNCQIEWRCRISNITTKSGKRGGRVPVYAKDVEQEKFNKVLKLIRGCHVNKKAVTE